MNIDQKQKQQTGSTEFLNFSDALHHLRWGEKIARRCWGTGPYVYAEYINGEENRLKYVGPNGPTNNWLHGVDIMAEDWYVI